MSQSQWSKGYIIIYDSRLHKRKGVNFMKNKKVFKIIGIILMIIFAIFLIHTIRNYIIITNLQKRVAKYDN